MVNATLSTDESVRVFFFSVLSRRSGGVFVTGYGPLDPRGCMYEFPCL